MPTTRVPEGKIAVLFDGVCNLCNGVVRFIIARDPRERVAFASLQSEAGRALLGGGPVRDGGLETVYMIDEKRRIWARSSAVLRIITRLRWPWPLLSILLVVPPPLRDAAYRLVARNRYRWFGKREQCWLPTPDLRRRFLQ